MKICPGCGQLLADSDTMCPNCGGVVRGPVQPAAHTAHPEAPAPRAGRFISIGAVLVALVLVLAGAALALSGLGSAPHKDFLKLQQELLESGYLERLEAALDTLGSGAFSSDLTLTAQVDEASFNRWLEGSSLTIKTELTRNSLLLNGEAALMGSPVLSGALSYDRGVVSFCLPQADESCYTADLSQVLTRLSGQPVDLSRLSIPEVSGRQWRELAEAYLGILAGAVTKDNVELSKGQTLRFNQLTGSYKGNVYTFTPTAEDIEGVLRALAAHLREDEQLRTLILQLVDPDALAAAFGPEVFGGEDFAQALDRAIRDLADSLEREALAGSRAIARGGLTWTLAVEDQQVRMIRVEADGSALVYERSGSEREGLSEVVYTDDSGYLETLLRQSYTRQGDTQTGSATLRLDSAWLYLPGVSYYYDSPVVTVDYTADTGKKSSLGVAYGSYGFTFQNMDLQLQLEVKESAQGGVDHTLTYRDRGEELFGGMFHTLELTVNATQGGSARMPSGPQVDIGGYSMEELSALLERLGGGLEQELMRTLAPQIFYGTMPYGG